MDDSDRATHQEEMMRDIALRSFRAMPSRDHEAEICPGCQYATRSNHGKNCEAWREYLEDHQKRERAVR